MICVGRDYRLGSGGAIVVAPDAAGGGELDYPATGRSDVVGLESLG